MKNIQLTCAHALVKFLIAQKTLIDGKKAPLFPGVFGIFGHQRICVHTSNISNHRLPAQVFLEGRSCFSYIAVRAQPQNPILDFLNF